MTVVLKYPFVNVKDAHTLEGLFLSSHLPQQHIAFIKTITLIEQSSAHEQHVMSPSDLQMASFHILV